MKMRKVSAVIEMCLAYGLQGMISFQKFKQLNGTDKTANGNFTRDSLIASITNVYACGQYTIIEFGDNAKLGKVILDPKNARVRKARGAWRGFGLKHSTKGKYGKHILVTIQNVDLSLESLILIADDYLRDTMLISYSGINANVKDGSGSINNSFGTMNMDIDNLEWCTSADNLAHGRELLYMKQCFNGEAYSCSALDRQFMTMLQLKNIFSPKQIYDYAKQHFERTL